jgi:hypothetical protein
MPRSRPATAGVLLVAQGEHRVRPDRFKHLGSAHHAAGVGFVAPSARRASDVPSRANDHRFRIPHGLGTDVQRGVAPVSWGRRVWGAPAAVREQPTTATRTTTIKIRQRGCPACRAGRTAEGARRRSRIEMGATTVRSSRISSAAPTLKMPSLPGSSDHRSLHS